MPDSILIHGARTHNLCDVSCSIPHGKLTVVTGPSGSGKSSLAFDTLYAEGQRRYVESLSAYARQFLERMERPDVDRIEGIQPAIALEQKNGVRSARSTVGTATETYDYLRLLFAKLGTTICPDCRRAVRPETPESAMAALADLDDGTRLIVLGPLDVRGAQPSDALRAELIRAGWHRLWDGERIVDLNDEADSATASAATSRDVEWAVVVDRLALRAGRQARLRTAIETAFRIGHGRARAWAPDLDRAFTFSAGMTCDACGRAFPLPEPHLFSFHSPLGACPECEGFGRIVRIDMDKVVPNPSLCIEDGAIAPWATEGGREIIRTLRRATTPAQIPRLKPIAEFTDAQRQRLFEGVGDFIGIRGFFDMLEAKRYKVQARVALARYRAYRPCPSCGGARLRPEALCVRFAEHTIGELTALPVRRLRPFFDELTLSPTDALAAERILETLRARLGYLDEVGLGYLTLERQTRTLSGGEAQRINLASALGSALTDTLYVLDEPTVGLHARDTGRLIHILEGLRALGNTIVVVEHDLDVIRAADRVLDLGPGAGEHGGRLLHEGTLRQLERGDTPTARFVREASARQPIPSRRRRPTRWVTVRGARGHNLRNLTARLPLGVFVCVTGVSGSGKTTLVRDTLHAHYRRRRDVAPVEAEPCDGVEGLDAVEEMIWVDPTPPAASTRSNPATFIKAYEAIRKAMAATREARALGLTARDFSFNVAGGRCETCRGTGRQTIDMHFMADVEVVCEACDGRRFQPRVLRMRRRGRNIADILEMTADEAVAFFKDEPKIARALAPLRQVGLGYLRLGQSTATLSGGEAQRLKLATHLSGRKPEPAFRRRQGPTRWFLFDEPTTGLHPSDLERLIAVFQAMVERGHSLLVIEHNLDLIAAADWIVDLGPEGGDLGGRVVAEGPVEAIMAEPASLTGQHLARRFERIAD